MRQALTAFLVLFFGLGPLTAALPGGEDAGLPPCCRRHGAHHCAMYMRMAALMRPSPTPAVHAPFHCPLYPGSGAVLLSSGYALTSNPGAPPVLAVCARLLVFEPAAGLRNPGRCHAGRGPPAPLSI